MASDPKPGPRGAQSTERALGLLRSVAASHGEGLSLAQLVQASGLDRTTAYRLLGALQRAGWVERDAASGLYRLGLEAQAQGMAALQRAPLIERCRSQMQALARRGGEPVFLVARAGDHSHCLHLEQGARPVRAFAETVGSQRLLGLGIPSFALLARIDDAAVSAHHRRHEAEYAAQQVGAALLLRRVRQTREAGHAQITARGFSGLAMAFGYGSCGDAALGIVAPASRLPRSRAAELAALLAQHVAELA